MEKLTKANLQEIMNKPLVFVDFWAGWCGPCMAIAPFYEAVAEKYKDKAVFVKCDVDEEIEFARSQGIMSIPCIIAYKEGKPVDKSVGLVNENTLSSFVERQIL